MKKKRRFILPVLLSIILIASLLLNFYQGIELMTGLITFQNANSRDTYFTAHNIKTAHELSTGKGIRVGIMDWNFGYNSHPNLYSDGINFSEIKTGLDIEEHGFWMANTLREIAPDCLIYALCIFDRDEDKKVDNMIRAIDWAIENNIDILTYSGMAFSEKNRPAIDESVKKAIEFGVITTFIHYDNELNLLPDGFFDFSDYNRDADVNILHYDYNVLFTSKYDKYMSFNGDYSKIKSGDDVPYLSMSSTSPVLAGFVAILKEINPNLSPDDYKDILINTSYQKEYYDWGFGRKSIIPHVADIGRAVVYIKENY